MQDGGIKYHKTSNKKLSGKLISTSRERSENSENIRGGFGYHWSFFFFFIYIRMMQ